MISETSKWKYWRERALTYSVLAENTKNGTKSPFFMICFSLPLSISSHLRKEKPTHTQLHAQQLKVQKKRNPKYPYQQMKRRNQEWLIPILANTDLLGFDKERRFGSIEKKKLRVLQCQNEVSRLSPLFVCRSHPLPSLFLV